MEKLKLEDIIDNNKQDEAILFLKRYKKRRAYLHLEKLSIENIIQHGKQDEVIAYLKYVKQRVRVSWSEDPNP